MPASNLWLEQDFRDLPESTGLPAGWEDTSPCFGPPVTSGILRERGYSFLRLQIAEKGKMQIRLPLPRRLTKPGTFRISCLARSSSNAGSLMGLRPLAGPEQADEVEVAAIFALTPAWRECSATAKGGPIKGPPAFSLNFGTPGVVDILRLRVEAIPSKHHTPEPAIPLGRVGDFGGGRVETHWRMSMDARTQKPAIAYWGDSLTGGWQSEGRAAWDRELAPLGAMNLGIGGDTVQNIHYRIQDAQLGSAFAPRLNIVMIGVNNLFCVHSPADISAGMETLLAAFHRLTPKAPLLLLGVLPVRHSPADGIRLRIADLNRRYKRLADNKRVFFADVGRSIVEPDGSISAATSADGCHLLAAGYERLVQALLPHVRRHIPTPDSDSNTRGM